MAKTHGTAGKTSRMLADKRRMLRIFVLLLAAFGMLAMLLIVLKASSALTGTAGLIVIIVFFAGLKNIGRATEETDRYLRKRTRNANRGAKGEDAVAGLLDTLPDSYTVFHDLAKLAGDIDHIVVGPTGIFVIETKAHGGKVSAEGDQIRVNGHPSEKDFIAQSWRNAFWVRDVLKNTAEIDVMIKPILVFSNAFVTARRPVKGIQVINKKFLVDTILREHSKEFPIERVVEILKMKLGSAQETPIVRQFRL